MQRKWKLSCEPGRPHARDTGIEDKIQSLNTNHLELAPPSPVSPSKMKGNQQYRLDLW